MIRQVRGPAHEPFAVHSFTYARLKHARSHIDPISTLMMAEMKVSLAWAMRRRSSERNRFRRYHRDTFLPRLIEILLLVRFHLFPDLRHPLLLRPYSLIRGDSCSRSHFHSVSRFSLSITALVEVKIRATDTYYPGQKGRMRFAISPSRHLASIHMTTRDDGAGIRLLTALRTYPNDRFSHHRAFVVLSP